MRLYFIIYLNLEYIHGLRFIIEKVNLSFWAYFYKFVEFNLVSF